MKRNMKINLLLLVVIIGMVIIENTKYISFNSTSMFIYYIKPLIWLSLGLITLKLPKVRPSAKGKYRGFLTEIIIYASIFYIIITFIAGLFLGLGKSPYSLTFLGIGNNLFSLLLGTIGREILRSYMINSNSKKLTGCWVVVVCFTFVAINIPMAKIFGIKNIVELTQAFAEIILPQIAISAFAIYLVYLGGSKLSICYICITQGIEYVTPILPDLNWLANSIIGVVGPVFSFIILQYLYMKKSKQLKKEKVNKQNPIGSIVATIVSIGVIWFSIGVFPVYPTVIVTGSMKPLIDPGDVVLVRKLKEPIIEQGDIIQFSSDNIYIFHRVIEVVEEKGSSKYKTKGDNNSAPDSNLVTVDKIKGKVIKVIPKLGWPSLWLKDRNNKDIKSKVEF